MMMDGAAEVGVVVAVEGEGGVKGNGAVGEEVDLEEEVVVRARKRSKAEISI